MEAPRVGAAYEDLVRETRRVAGPKIRKAWDEPALTADADVHTEGIDFADLKSFDDGYLREVRDHLSVWPRWISARWRGGEKERRRSGTRAQHRAGRAGRRAAGGNGARKEVRSAALTVTCRGRPRDECGTNGPADSTFRFHRASDLRLCS